jgi:hypothetical protein
MTPPPELTASRFFIVHLTPFAPGCAGLDMSHPNCNRMFGRPPLVAVRALLSRLRIAPEQVRAQTGPQGDPELIRVVDGWPLALIWAGANAAELNQLLRLLVGAGWRPKRVDAIAALPPRHGSTSSQDQAA